MGKSVISSGAHAHSMYIIWVFQIYRQSSVALLKGTLELSHFGKEGRESKKSIEFVHL